MTDLQKAAEMILKHVNDNRRARASYPDADLPIEAAMRLLAEHCAMPACEFCGYRGPPVDTDGDAVCCAGCGEWDSEENRDWQEVASKARYTAEGTFCMTLTPAEFVRWTVDGAHHTGRVMRLSGHGDVVGDDGWIGISADRVLVRHSFTHDLEFVPWGELVACPEEHPE